MKKFEKREYSSNYLEQSKAVDQFKNKLKKDTLVELVNKLDNYKYLLSNNYHDRKMEVYEKVYLNGIKKSWLSTEERRILSSEEKLNREKQKYECELKAEREKNLEEKNLFEAVASNVDVIDLIIDEVMNKLVDLNVTEIDNLVSEKALQSLRTANGFIENSDVDVRFITYSSHYNRVIKNILEYAKQKVKLNSNLKNNNDVINNESINNPKEKINALEQEKRDLLERLVVIEEEIRNIKENNNIGMTQENTNTRTLK